MTEEERRCREMRNRRGDNKVCKRMGGLDRRKKVKETRKEKCKRERRKYNKTRGKKKGMEV